MKRPCTTWGVALCLAACTPEPPGPPTFDAPPLRDVRPELEAIAASGTPPPDDAALASLRDLVETAFAPGIDAGLAARARDALLDEPDVHWALEEALGHDDTGVRSFAAFHLGSVGTAASRFALLKRLKYEKDSGCRIWVIDALDKLGSRAGADALARLLTVGPRSLPDDSMRQAGEVAIRMIESAGHILDGNPGYDELRTALRALPPAPPADPVDGDSDARVARLILDLAEFQLRPVDDARLVLAHLAGEAVPRLEIAIHADDPYLRNHALEVLRDIGPSASPTVPAVRKLLGDSLSAPYAIQALAAMQDRESAATLIALLDAGSAEVRVAAAGALGPIGADDAVPALAELTANEDAPMDERVQAAFSLEVLTRDRTGLDFLTERLQAEDYHPPTVRELIARLRTTE